jgi:hypothetical protein
VKGLCEDGEPGNRKGKPNDITDGERDRESEYVPGPTGENARDHSDNARSRRSSRDEQGNRENEKICGVHCYRHASVDGN